MKITFTKLSDRQHRLHVLRDDGSQASLTMDSRSYLRHDLAHLAAESCLGIAGGYWGLVAAGAALDGDDLKGPDLMRAERVAGPVQTLMRVEAAPERFYEVLHGIEPATVTRELAERIWDRCRQLAGHWRATPYGGEMVLDWEVGG